MVQVTLLSILHQEIKCVQPVTEKIKMQQIFAASNVLFVKPNLYLWLIFNLGSHLSTKLINGLLLLLWFLVGWVTAQF